MTRDYDYEEKVNDAYKKVLEYDKEKIDEIKDKKDKQFKWTHGINDAYKKAINETVDMTGEKCEKCKKGVYKETSIHDDADGVLHCSECNDQIKRYK